MPMIKISFPISLVDGRGIKYRIQLPNQTGGKAGKGKNVTSTIQVFYKEFFLIKQVRYKVDEPGAKKEALEKALIYCIGQRETKEYFKQNYL